MTSKDRPASSSLADTSLANRYGRQKRSLSAKGKKIWAGAALAASVGFMGWIATSNATDSVTFKDISFRTADATLTEVDFQVTRNPGTAVKCAVKALDSKFAIVGWKVVEVPAGVVEGSSDSGRTVAQRSAIRTESMAATGVVDNCWAVDAAG